MTSRPQHRKPPPPRPAATAEAKDRNPLGVPVALLLVFVLLVTLGQAVYLVGYVEDFRQQRDALVCQARLNIAFREALAARTDAAARERAAQRELLSSVIAQNFGEDDVNDYLALLSQADAERVANPLPDTFCPSPED